MLRYLDPLSFEVRSEHGGWEEVVRMLVELPG